VQWILNEGAEPRRGPLSPSMLLRALQKGGLCAAHRLHQHLSALLEYNALDAVVRLVGTCLPFPPPHKTLHGSLLTSPGGVTLLLPGSGCQESQLCRSCCSTCHGDGAHGTAHPPLSCHLHPSTSTTPPLPYTSSRPQTRQMRRLRWQMAVSLHFQPPPQPCPSTTQNARPSHLSHQHQMHRMRRWRRPRRWPTSTAPLWARSRRATTPAWVSGGVGRFALCLGGTAPLWGCSRWANTHVGKWEGCPLCAGGVAHPASTWRGRLLGEAIPHAFEKR